MTKKESIAYDQGNRAAWQALLKKCFVELGYDGKPDAVLLKQLINEREAVIQSLRSLCREFGDNEWTEDLNLQDVIEKHLVDNLRS